jgi:hypothetical protein
VLLVIAVALVTGKVPDRAWKRPLAGRVAS